MRRIAKKQEMPVDTSRDYEFTNRKELDRVIEELLPEVAAVSATPS